MKTIISSTIAAIALLTFQGCSQKEKPKELVVYSGRSQSLVEEVFNRFEAETGIAIKVRYGSSSDLALSLVKAGEASNADLFFSQDAGALGLLASRDLLAPLPEATIQSVDSPFASPEGLWVGVTGRARVLVYNPEKVKKRELPKSIFDLTQPKWKNRLGWAPMNASFQSFVTALRVLHGEDKTRQWLLGVKANEPREYPKNDPAVLAVGTGEIDAALVNHYYLFRFDEYESASFSAINYFFPGGDGGSLINVAGAAVLKNATQPELAHQFIEFLLSEPIQEYFATNTLEYPLRTGVQTSSKLPSLDSIAQPDIDLSKLDDLQGTLKLLRETEIIP